MCLLFGNLTITWETRQWTLLERRTFHSVAFGFNCGRWKTRYASEHFLKFVLKGVVSILLLVDVVLNNNRSLFAIFTQVEMAEE